MKLPMILLWFLLSSLPFSAAPAPAQEDEPQAETLQKESLQKDVDILERVVRELHPGLFRHHDEASLKTALDELRSELDGPRTRAEAYLAFSRFAATIRCGHTYANFWNQSKSVQEELFHRRDKLPFTFSWLGERMIVRQYAGAAERPGGGHEVLSINGVKAAARCFSSTCRVPESRSISR